MRAGVALHAALDPLGPAPAISDDYVTSVTAQSPQGWVCWWNDSLGDCVAEDSGHALMLRTANAGSIVIPSAQDILGLYEAVGGYKPGDPSTDRGCDESSMCQYLETSGLCGHRSAGSGPIDPARLDHIRWAVQIFGSCRLGITVTQSMMDAFSAGQPWEKVSGDVLGGHDVPVVRYDAEYAWVVTWGKLQPITWTLMGESAFLEEANGEAWPDLCRAGGTAPNGFDLAGMLAKLALVREAT